MSAEARYFRVGLFVFIGMALIAAFAVVLGGGALFRQTIEVETYIEEAVTGLEIGSPVKLRGVQIGSVSKIGFVEDRYSFDDEADRLEYGNLVRVVMDVTPTDPEVSPTQRKATLATQIEKGLRLQLAVQGITGVSFLQADFMDPEGHPPMKILWEPRHLYVPSAPSTIAAISSAVERVMKRLEDAKLESVVQNLDALLVTLNDRVASVDTAAISKDTKRALARLDGTLARVQRMIDGGQYDVQVSLDNLRVTTENLRDLTESLRAQPSLLLRGTEPEASEAPE